MTSCTRSETELPAEPTAKSTVTSTPLMNSDFAPVAEPRSAEVPETTAPCASAVTPVCAATELIAAASAIALAARVLEFETT